MKQCFSCCLENTSVDAVWASFCKHKHLTLDVFRHDQEADSSSSCWSVRDRSPQSWPQAHLENITFARVSEDDLRLYSDQCFLNLFRLSQLLLEYLLSVQDTLATSLEVPNVHTSDTIYLLADALGFACGHWELSDRFLCTSACHILKVRRKHSFDMSGELTTRSPRKPRWYLRQSISNQDSSMQRTTICSVAGLLAAPFAALQVEKSLMT